MFWKNNKMQDNINKHLSYLEDLLLDISGRFLITEAGRQEYDLRYHDLLFLLNEIKPFLPEDKFSVETEHPVALDSNDHKYPHGTKNDNTRSPRFALACERQFPGNKPLHFIDLGCSGGGLVLDFLLRGHKAVGLEGSDYSLKAARACWRLLANKFLFTADVSKPFNIFHLAIDKRERERERETFSAHVISAWELLEHLEEEQLPEFFENIKRHLRADGIFIGSIGLTDEVLNGIVYHKTKRSYRWWEKNFYEHGLAFTNEHIFEFKDFCRGTSNGYYDGDYSLNPELGFHFVARKG